MSGATPREKALAIIADITRALGAGVRHRDVRGRALTTPLEILTALRDDGAFEFELPEGERPLGALGLPESYGKPS